MTATAMPAWADVTCWTNGLVDVSYSVAGDAGANFEQLCRYIARPAVATGQQGLTAQELVRYTLKTPYRDGATHVIFEPLDFIARLAALVPKPRVHLTRYHGVLAPHSALRAQVTPAWRGRCPWLFGGVTAG